MSAIDWFNKAYTTRDLFDFTQQIEFYSKAIELNPHFADAYYYRGDTYFGLGNFDSAVRDYTKAIELNIQIIYVYKMRAFLYEKLHNTKAAVDDWNRYLKINVNADNEAESEWVRKKIRDLGYTPQY